MSKEKVLVVPAFKVNSNMSNLDILTIVNEAGFFIDRDIAESCIDLRQIIPYIILYERQEQKVFLYERLAKSGEVRLVKKRSIGVGGHINPEDMKLLISGETPEICSCIEVAAQRELSEEISLEKGFDPSKLHFLENIICLETTEVDKVHLGLPMVYLLDPSDTIKVIEEDKMSGSLVHKSMTKTFELEEWSKAIDLENLKIQ